MLVVVVFVVAISAIVTIIRSMVSNRLAKSSTGTEESVLLSNLADRSVEMKVRGPLVADESFSTFSISVSQNRRVLTKKIGYLGEEVEKIELENNAKAYDEFIHALDKANMMRGNEFTADKNDLRGICATGKVYEFSTLKNSEPVKMLWTSTCKGSPGSLKASTDQLYNLFISQVPDAKALISKF
jgi:hypothetical protein